MKKKSDVGGKDVKKEKTKSKEKEKLKKVKDGDKTGKGKEVLNYTSSVKNFVPGCTWRKPVIVSKFKLGALFPAID